MLFVLHEIIWFAANVPPFVRYISAAISILALGLIAIFIPEGFLITHDQLVRAFKTYKLLENKTRENQDHLSTYLDMVQKMVAKES